MLRAALSLGLVLALAAPAVAAEIAPRPAPISALPLVERPSTQPGDTLVVLYSGDGGWAGLDRGVADSLSRAGLPVVGIDSLRYFWRARSPEQAAADLESVLARYMTAWSRTRVILVGYSFGADALPPIVAHLSAAARARVRLVALVSAEPMGELQFHAGSWLNLRSADAYPLAPILAGLRDTPMVCIYGDRDRASACATLAPRVARPLRLSGDHHFNNDYAAIARAILESARP